MTTGYTLLELMRALSLCPANYRICGDTFDDPLINAIILDEKNQYVYLVDAVEDMDDVLEGKIELIDSIHMIYRVNRDKGDHRA